MCVKYEISARTGHKHGLQRDSLITKMKNFYYSSASIWSVLKKEEFHHYNATDNILQSAAYYMIQSG